jgi:hypothetical protein
MLFILKINMLLRIFVYTETLTLGDLHRALGRSTTTTRASYSATSARCLARTTRTRGSTSQATSIVRPASGDPQSTSKNHVLSSYYTLYTPFIAVYAPMHPLYTVDTPYIYLTHPLNPIYTTTRQVRVGAAPQDRRARPPRRRHH